MIPKASQRGLGEDLATHLMNEEDNEYREVAEIRGAIAQDLHGAFAEWEPQAHALTRCKNYLYSLSINPDHYQRRLTREEYFDYIEATEKKLGLNGQPRAVVFHIKEDQSGEPREHCHVVWSRIDSGQGKAVHLAFDHDKLMMVTRQFAHEHGLKLPDGYYKDREGKKHQVTLYEQHQQKLTGVSLAERKAIVTQAWQRSDSAKSFVQALQERGYMLATGNKPYVLVDLYGCMNSLPKLIDDRQVRTKDVRALLENEFPPESLPTVDEALQLAAEHRKAREDFAKANFKAEELNRLKDRQAGRRQKIEADVAKGEQRQAKEFRDLKERHRRERAEARDAYLNEVRRIRAERRESEPKGLSGFLSRFTGITRIREMIQRQRDKKLYETFIAGRLDLLGRQQSEERALQHRHHLQKLDSERRLRALGRIEDREQKSLDEKRLAAQRIKQRGSREQVPAISLELKPRGRPATPYKAKNRYISPHREKTKRRLTNAEITEKAKMLSLCDEFYRASSEGRSGESEGDAAGELKPVAETTLRRKEAQKDAGRKGGSSERIEEFNRVAGDRDSSESSGDVSVAFNRTSKDKTQEEREGTLLKEEYERVPHEGKEANEGEVSETKSLYGEQTSRRRRRKRKRDKKQDGPEVTEHATTNKDEDTDRPLEEKKSWAKDKKRRSRKRDREKDRGL